MTQKKILKEDDEKIGSVFIKAISKLVFTLLVIFLAYFLTYLLHLK